MIKLDKSKDYVVFVTKELPYPIIELWLKCRGHTHAPNVTPGKTYGSGDLSCIVTFDDKGHFLYVHINDTPENQNQLKEDYINLTETIKADHYLCTKLGRLLL